MMRMPLRLFESICGLCQSQERQRSIDPLRSERLETVRRNWYATQRGPTWDSDFFGACLLGLLKLRATFALRHFESGLPRNFESPRSRGPKGRRMKASWLPSPQVCSILTL